MKGLIGLTTLLVLFSTHAAVAQQPPGTKAGVRGEVQDVLRRSGITAALDSIAATSTPELEQALDQLAAVLTGLASRIANDPELRRSSLQAAQGMIGIAQVVVEEQSKVLQDVLRAAAKEIAAVPGQESPVREPH